jgi:hypothetical protein
MWDVDVPVLNGPDLIKKIGAVGPMDIPCGKEFV